MDGRPDRTRIKSAWSGVRNLARHVRTRCRLTVTTVVIATSDGISSERSRVGDDASSMAVAPCVGDERAMAADLG